MKLGHWETVGLYLYSNDIEGAAAFLESRLGEIAKDRFSSLPKFQFTNSPSEVFQHLKLFVEKCQLQFDVEAIYLEMNGFDINYARWYFDSFAYEKAGDDPDDTDWLCDWSSPDWKEFTLNGLEAVQDDFCWYVENDIYKVDSYKPVRELAILLVMVRFLQLIRDSLETGSLDKAIKVIATAHDFDMFGRFITKCMNVR